MRNPRSILLSLTSMLSSIVFFLSIGISSAHAQVPHKSVGKTFNPGHYVLLASKTKIEQDILINPDIEGVKVKFSWHDLEPRRGAYDFSEIEDDIALLKRYDKQLWIQIEYITWNSTAHPETPAYMWNDSSYGGDPRYYGNYERTVQDGGWYPLFWNARVRERLAALVSALGERFNDEPTVEGLSIPETAAAQTSGFDCNEYLKTLKEMVTTANRAFSNKHVIHNLNFACFDLAEHASWLNSIGVGIGTPDIYTFKSDLTQGVYPLFLKYGDSVTVGPDVQWANYDRNDLTVAQILDFAIKNTNPWYIFWQRREPYFSEQLLRAIHSRKLPRAEAYYGNADSSKRPNPPVLSSSE